MRKTNFYLLFLLLFMAFMQGCEKTDDGTYTAPITLYEKIGGSWSMTTLTQIDEVAKVNALKPDEIAMTSHFNFRSFVISLNVDSSFLPTTYEVAGSAPELFAPSGYWELDDPFVHADGTSTNIFLYADEAKTQLTDKLIVLAIPGKTNVLEFSLTRSDKGSPYVTYEYRLKPAN
ncbi:MAG: DUF5004 domain-containing protein [Bacteroidales bacterium]|nr:DUF5004 domain-containing protein [Bacteroidales bacterium]